MSTYIDDVSLKPRVPAARRLAVKLFKKLRISKLLHPIYYHHLRGFEPSSPHVLPALDRVLDEIKTGGIEGDYLEFGLFKGYSFYYAQHTAKKVGVDSMRFFGFDSFAGLPEPQGVDETPLQDFFRGQYCCDKDRVTANLDSKGVDWNKTFLIEGYYNESLTPDVRETHQIHKVAVALLDCDLYESTRDALSFIAPMLGDGSVVIFDDWNAFESDNYKGQRLAFREFLQEHDRFEAEEMFAYGHYSIVFRLTEQVAEQQEGPTGAGVE